MINQVANDIGKAQAGSRQIDPGTILVIIQVIVFVIKTCNPSIFRVNNPSLLDKLRLYLVVKKQLKKYDKNIKPTELMEHIVNRAKSISQSELNEIQLDVKSM